MAIETRPTVAETPKVPQVSIGMPVYNGEKFIRGTLHSLLAQTFTDFELIISDNASTDGTEAICRGYAERDARIRYVRQIANLGPQGNFRFVLDEAIGEYFMWAAYDDIRSADFIKVLLNGLKDNTDFVSAFGVFKEINDDGSCFGENIILDYSGETANRRIFKYGIDCRPLKDVWIYGLHRRRALYEMRLKPWFWVNKDNPRNSAHPVLIFMLAKGNYYFYSEQTVFYRRVLKSGSLWTMDLRPRKFVWRQFCFFFLKLNLIVRSTSEAIRGSKSIVTGLLSFFLTVRWVAIDLAKLYLKGTIPLCYRVLRHLNWISGSS